LLRYMPSRVAADPKLVVIGRREIGFSLGF